MNEITSRVVYEVDGQQFDTEAEAAAYVHNIARQQALQEFLYDNSHLGRADAERAAGCVLHHWQQVQEIVGGR